MASLLPVEPDAMKIMLMIMLISTIATLPSLQLRSGK
jgi:hypothetical protein